MYGWLHAGGGIDKYFCNNRLDDIILRSSSINNNVIIGNHSTQSCQDAAIYVSRNNVGIHKLPSQDVALDVKGHIKTDSFLNVKLEQHSLVVSPSNLTLSQASKTNIQMDDRGMIQNELLLTRDIRRKKFTLSNISFSSVSKQQIKDYTNVFVDGYVLLIQKPLEMYFKEGDLLCINNTLYTVLNILETYTHIQIEVICYFHQEYDLSIIRANDPQNIDVFQDYTKQDKSEQVYLPITVTDYAISTVYLNITCQLQDAQNISFLKRRTYFHIKDSRKNVENDIIENIMILIDFYYPDPQQNPEHVSLIFKSIDNKSTLYDVMNKFGTPIQGKSLFLFALRTETPPSIRESNVMWGTYVTLQGQRYMSFTKNMQLTQYVNPQDLQVNTLESIIFNDVVKFDIDTMFSTPSDGILVRFIQTQLEHPLTERGSIYYQYIGFPVHIVSASYLDNRIVRYVIDDTPFNFFTFLKEYNEEYVYVIDQVNYSWRIKNIVINGARAFIDLSKASGETMNMNDAYTIRSRIVYMLPFKFQSLTMLGNEKDNCFIKNALGIGTNIITETLTVNGSASVKNQIKFYDESSLGHAYIKLYNDKLDINNTIFVDQNEVSIQNSTVVKGVMTANDFLSVSDRMLKKNITSCDPHEDLDLIMKLDIKEYEFIDQQVSTGQKKGVIAQDIERILPGIVSTTWGFIPSVYKQARVINQLCIKLVETCDASHLKRDTPIKLVLNGHEHVAKVLKVALKSKPKIILKEPLPSAFLDQKVFVYGHYGKYKTLDKDYLFMTTMNSVKELASKIQSLEKQLKHM